MSNDITPQQAIRLAERQPGLSPKERQKMLALALMRVSSNAMELAILWNISVMFARGCGFEIPALDAEFVVDVNRNPSAYQDYK